MLMLIVKLFHFPDAPHAAIFPPGAFSEDRHMTTRTLPASHAIRTGVEHGAALLNWLRRAFEAIETRRHLAEMDRRMLADIGISRSEALEEAARAPWDLVPRRR